MQNVLSCEDSRAIMQNAHAKAKKIKAANTALTYAEALKQGLKQAHAAFKAATEIANTVKMWRERVFRFARVFGFGTDKFDRRIGDNNYRLMSDAYSYNDRYEERITLFVKTGYDNYYKHNIYAQRLLTASVKFERDLFRTKLSPIEELNAQLDQACDAFSVENLLKNYL